MMSSFAEFACKSAETAFKKTTGNKKTMTAVASKGRLGLFLSTCLVAAATADDASGPALRGDVLALAPQDPGLFPEDALASDGGAPPDDAKGEEGPPASRRLQAVRSEAGGWRVFEGKYLEGHNTLTLEGGEGGGDVEYCKALCISFEWCVNFDVTTVHHASGATKCFLSNHEVVGDRDAFRVLTPVGWNNQDPRFDFYKLDRTQLTQPAWTKHEGKYLEGRNTLTLDGEGGGDVKYCKAICVSLPWCVNIDVMTNRPKCFLSDHEAGGDVLAPHGTQDFRFDHYTLDRTLLLQQGPFQATTSSYVAIMRQLCEDAGVGDQEYETRGRPSNYGTGGNAFLPFCDVSERRDFEAMFYLSGLSGHELHADLSQWDVGSGTSFQLMFGELSGFDQDLSRWNIHRYWRRGNEFDNRFRADVSRMFYRTGMSEIGHCPCIEWDDDQWSRWCPGLEASWNPSSHEEAAADPNLDCEPWTHPGCL